MDGQGLPRDQCLNTSRSKRLKVMIKCMPRKLQNVIERVGIIPPSISQRALQPNKEIFQPDRSVSRSCMYCNIVQWLNTVGMSIRVYTRVSYVHMILENFYKTSGVVREIYSLLREMSCFANLAFSMWKQRTEMKLCKVGLYRTSIEHIFSAVNFKHSLLVCDSVFSS